MPAQHPTTHDDHASPETALPPEIRELDLERVKWKLHAEDPAYWTPERLDAACQEYRRFLALKHAHPEMVLVPTEDVDKVWHTHILDTARYREDTQRIFGAYLDHHPHIDIDGTCEAADRAMAWEQTAEAYEDLFGEALPDSQGARCDGKACHAPTPCDCR